MVSVMFIVIHMNVHKVPLFLLVPSLYLEHISFNFVHVHMSGQPCFTLFGYVMHIVLRNACSVAPHVTKNVKQKINRFLW